MHTTRPRLRMTPRSHGNNCQAVERLMSFMPRTASLASPAHTGRGRQLGLPASRPLALSNDMAPFADIPSHLGYVEVSICVINKAGGRSAFEIKETPCNYLRSENFSSARAATARIDRAGLHWRDSGRYQPDAAPAESISRRLDQYRLQRLAEVAGASH